MAPKLARTDVDKKCVSCLNTKPLSEFYLHRKGDAISYSGKCKSCYSAHYKAYRASPHGREVYQAWTKTETGSISIQNRIDKWRKKNKEHRRCHSKISNAIRDNRLTRQPCRICGTAGGEAHHLSYDDPYNIDWLCKSCHTKLHYP